MMFCGVSTFVLGLAVFVPSVVIAQTSFTLETITLTDAPPLPTTSGAPGSMSLECYQVSTYGGGVASIPVASPNPGNLAGLTCWEVFPTGGGTARVPVTATSINFAPTAFQTAVPGESTSSSSTNNSVKVIVPAVIGSVVASALIVVGAVWFVRNRRRQNTQNSRAGRWAATKDGEMRQTNV